MAWDGVKIVCQMNHVNLIKLKCDCYSQCGSILDQVFCSRIFVKYVQDFDVPLLYNQQNK